jgi:putative protease
MSRPEILAPAGSFESAVAACVCGADAVYLGGKTLNARRNAGNFDEDALDRVVAYCHLHGVKVYQTLNTVLFDDETEELLAAAKTAAAVGIDGAIVQDLGVLRLLKEAVPELRLSASTQMAVHNVAGALEAERLGYSNLVLARELSAAEIGRITRALTSATTEVFVHGALCMCVSGQCYLSSMLGGRSGNRGLCAQPCRLPFAAGNKTHALSLKDLSLVERVQELAALGVSSLKIEGRMKRPEYVAAAVTALRAALNGEKADMDQLQSVFSRSGFTTGYFDNRRDGTMFGIRQKEDVVAANSVLDTLSRLATRETPRVPLCGTLTAHENAPVTLSACDRDGNEAFVTGEAPLIAENRPTDEARARQNLEKTGGTPFYWEKLTISLGEGLLLPAAGLNALRREALDTIAKKRQARRTMRYTEPVIAPNQSADFAPAQLRARCTAAQITRELLRCCGCVTVPLSDVEAAIEKGATPAQLAVEIPRILFEGEEKIPPLLEKAKACGVTRAWCGNIGAIRLAREAGMSLTGGWPLNLTNRHALQQAAEMGVGETELSFELGLPRLRRMSADIPFGIVAYGQLPLMVYRNCPMKAAVGCEACRGKGELTDRTGTKFPLRCRDGVTELLNSVPLYLADRLEEYRPAAFYTLWFTTETPERCALVAAQYARRAAATPPQGYTRGLYTRNVF